jgi:hypothetical protein
LNVSREHCGGARKRGRPPGRSLDETIPLRLSGPLKDAVDSWIAQADPRPSRSEALRRLIEAGLGATLTPARNGKGQDFSGVLVAHYQTGGVKLLERGAKNGLFDRCAEEFLAKRPTTADIFRALRHAGEHAALAILERGCAEHVANLPKPLASNGHRRRVRGPAVGAD